MVGQKILLFVSKILPTKIAYAHCDVPCGIYDPKPAQIAAATVLKMVEKIKELDSGLRQNDNTQAMNKFVRCVLTKEEHARKCKEEILILWTDFFKQEHLKMFPNLHDIFWQAAKLCSINKQEVSIEHAQELVKTVDEIAEMFKKAKTASTSNVADANGDAASKK